MYWYLEYWMSKVPQRIMEESDSLSRGQRFADLPADAKRTLYTKFLQRGYRNTYDDYCRRMEQTLVDPVTLEITEIH